MLTSRYFDDDRVLAKMCAPRRPLCRNRGIVKKRCDPGCVFRKLFFFFCTRDYNYTTTFFEFCFFPSERRRRQGGERKTSCESSCPIGIVSRTCKTDTTNPPPQTLWHTTTTLFFQNTLLLHPAPFVCTLCGTRCRKRRRSTRCIRFFSPPDRGKKENKCARG